MKAENSHINHINQTNVSFKGYVGTKAQKGKEFLKFYPPVYNKQEGDKIYLEIRGLKRSVNKDGGGHNFTVWVNNDEVQPLLIEDSAKDFAANSGFMMPRNATFLTNTVYKNDDCALGYRFVVKDREGNVKEYLNDYSGTKSVDNGAGSYNVITKNQSVPTLNGPIYHMFFNSFAPETTKQSDMPTRTHFNDADTTIKNVQKKLNEGVLDPYKLILSTPVFGKDEVSSNGYWTTNPYQINSKIGSIEDFMDLQNALFDKGKAWIADGAFTSQGYQSPLVANVLKHGDNSPFKSWLKIDSQPVFGVFPDEAQTDSETFKHIKFRLVNSPSDNKEYESTKPTYIQFYDDRLVSEEQLRQKNAIIERYDKHVPELKNGSKDPYAISTHQDSVQHYVFAINPNDKQKMSELAQFEGQSLADIKKDTAEELFDFGNFKIAEKNSASGANFWDGQVDLIKMNLSGCENTPESKAGMVQARNYLYGCATYWTKATNNSLIEHISQMISDNQEASLSQVQKAFDIDDDKIKAIKDNIQNGKYNFDILNSNLGVNSEDSKNDFILNEIVNFPLESIEFSPETTGVIASPYVSARPTMVKYQNAPKIDLVRGTYKGSNEEVYAKYAKTNSKMNSLYMNEIYSVVQDVLASMKTPEPIFKEGTNDLTDYGKFITKIITPDIVKYAVVNSLYGDNDIILDASKGKINYDYDSLRKESLDSLNQDTPELEAENLISVMQNGLQELSDSSDISKLANTLSTRFENTTLDDFKLAQAIVDETGAGLNWRFDAAKDIADNNQLFDGNSTYAKVFDESIDFWKNFVSNIKNENSNSYTIGEVTDLYKFLQGDYTSLSKEEVAKMNENAGRYSEDITAQRIFIEDTGMTTLTNYAQMYGALPSYLSSALSIDGKRMEDDGYGKTHVFVEQLGKFLNAGPLSMVNYAHVATGNHDKPRIMHGMALDMDVFLFDNNEVHSPNHVEKFKRYIADVLGIDESNASGINYNKYSSFGIATAKKMKDTIKELDNSLLNNNAKQYIYNALGDIAQGKYIEQDEPNLKRAAAFGNDDMRASLSNVIDFAIYKAQEDAKTAESEEKKANKLEIAKTLEKSKKEVVDNSITKILEKPMREELRIWQLMNVISGNPTLYSGDEYAQTGYETPSKNVYVKNRGIVNHNIVRESGNEKIKAYNKHMRAISQIHNIKGLSALSGGSISNILGVWCGEGWPEGNASRCIIQNDDKGSLTFTVLTPFNSNVKSRNDDVLYDEPKDTDKIKLFDWNGKDLPSAITPDTKLGRVVYNEKTGQYEPDGKTYKIDVENGNYSDGCYIKSEDGKPITLTGLATYFYKI